MTATQKWKPSCFNVVVPAQDGYMLFNSVSSETLALSDGQLPVLEDALREIAATGRSHDEDLCLGLRALGFIVPIGDDEYQREHRKFLDAQAEQDALYLTIVPSMACNLRCTYCFQQNIEHTKADKANFAQGVLAFVQQKMVGCKRLVVQWFGGEPLINYAMIRSLSASFLALCEERGASYHAEMLTNGTLIKPQMIAQLGDMAIRAIQIPLDGVPSTYAHRKQVSLAKAQAYYSFLAQHLDAIAEATGSVTIRINVDRENAEEAKQVVAFFRQQGVSDSRIDFRLGFLNTSRGIIECIPHDCLSYTEFADLELDFRQFLADQGYRVYGKPGARHHPCAAALWNSYTISPDGRIGKCVPAVGTTETAFAQINTGDIAQTMRQLAGDAPFHGFDPFESASCKGCALLPACLGSCPKMHLPDHTLVCSMKEGLGDTLAFYHSYYHATAAQREQACG
ncbi:SPASM domain-containing protein [Chloroflexia bacterium SDU3-3]|nr:SPASM domain-containing protein [Chloroflexia bacterium SDU3-3]